MKFPLRIFHTLETSIIYGGLIALSACTSTAPVKVVAQPTYIELMTSAEEAQKKGSAAEALGYFEDAAKADPSKKQPWLRIAQAQFDARNYGAAITASQEVLQRDTVDVTAKSIMAVSGLRVSAGALEQLRQANAVSGNTREEAQTLARTMRDALGESILPPAAAASEPSGVKPSKSAVRKTAPSVPSVNPVVPATKPSSVPEPKRNPFEALKG